MKLVSPQRYRRSRTHLASSLSSECCKPSKVTSSPWEADGKAEIVAVELQLERDDVLRLKLGWEYARDERGRMDDSMVWVNAGAIVSMFGKRVWLRE